MLFKECFHNNTSASFNDPDIAQSDKKGRSMSPRIAS
jgi:hypothetical protein